MTTTIDWYGCATFRLRTAGLTIFLDAYIDRAPIADGSGFGAADGDAPSRRAGTYSVNGVRGAGPRPPRTVETTRDPAGPARRLGARLRT